MILATDMIFHYELQENMAAILDVFQPSSNEELVLMEHHHKESSSGSSSSGSSNDSTGAKVRFKEEEATDSEIVAFVTPCLRDIFASLGENSPLLYFLDRYDLRPPDSSGSINNSQSSHMPPVSTNAKLPPSAYCPTPFPTLSSSSTSSTSSTNRTSNTTNTSQSHHTFHDSDDDEIKSARISNESQSPALPLPQPNVMTATIDNTGAVCLNRNHRLILCQSLLHAADISNPMRPWPICYTWSQRVCTEFFHQGDMERMNGLSISPNMDRRKTNQLTVGLKFSDFVVSPYFEIFAALFPKADALLELLKENRLRWLETIQEENKINKRRKSLQQGPIEEETGDHGDNSDAMVLDKNYQSYRDDDDMNQDSEEEDDFGDHGRIPDPLVPVGVLNPSGRRVSVAAGMAVIPDDLEKRIIGTGPRRRVYWGIRSASYADALHQVKSNQLRLAHRANLSQRSSSLGGDHLMHIRNHAGKCRRNSEQVSSPSLH